MRLAFGLLSLFAATAVASPWRTDRPVKAVVVGGSISRYYAGNFGQYLEFGCRDLEVLNRGKVGAGGAELARIVRDEVVGDPAIGKSARWLLFQGGLNSVWSPESTAWFLSRLFVTAHDAGLKVVALSLTPWGANDDPRFDGWRGLKLHKATEQVVDFVLGKLTPKEAFGARAKGHAETWLPQELPDIGVDLWRSALRAGTANPPRDRAALAATFGTGPYGKQAARKDELLTAAQGVPHRFLAQKYHDFDHVHPNGEGHRLIAALVCQQAPPEWACDCAAIRRASWKGRVIAGR